MNKSQKVKRGKVEKYNKWGYIFLIPFVLTYVIFQLIPLFNTVYNSFFENYRSGLMQVGPNFIGVENYKHLFVEGYFWKYLKKYNDHVGDGLYSTDPAVIVTGCLVL